MFTNVTLIFFLLLVPLSGFIAWAGDRIGHRTGKKRHTLWGLRPRHTAMVFTVGTGIGIAAISFGLFYASSEGFRVLISEGESLVQKNRDLKDDNARQGNLLTASQRQVTESVARAKLAGEERKDAEDARDLAKDGQRSAEKQAKTARAELNTATATLLNARANLATIRQSLATVQTNLTDTTERLRSAEGRVKVAEARVRTAEQRVRVAEIRVRVAEAKATAAESKASKVASRAEETLRAQRRILNGRLADQKQDFDAKITAQKKLFDDQEVQTAEQKKALAEVARELAEKRAELQEVTRTTAALQATTAALRGKQITYRLGEEVDRISIRSGHSIWRVQNVLEAFLSTAAKKAESRGAGRQNAERAVFILPRPVSLPRAMSKINGPRSSVASLSINAVSSASDVAFITEEDTIRAVASAIRTTNEDVVVVAAAAANAVAGEPVAIELKTYKNPVLFRESDKIAEGEIDGSASRQAVADALYVFLRNDVRGKLLDAGIIPIAQGSDSAGANAIATVVNLTGDEWLHLMEDVRQAGARAVITVRAARALRAGDMVALRFQVRGTNGGSAMTQTSGLEATR